MKSILKKRTKGKKQKGGGESSLNPFNLVLIAIILFLLYQMNRRSDTTVPKRIIVKHITKDKSIGDESIEDQPYRDDIYKPDLRQARSYPPFNIKTRGPPQEYDMVGFIKDSDDSNKLQQLYGRRTYPNSNLWNYYVKSDQYHQIPIPVSIGGQNCTDERGCMELNDQESLNLLDKEHTATIYKPEPYYYNPYII